MATPKALPFSFTVITFFLISHLFFFFCCFHGVAGSVPSTIPQNSRVALEIIIGGGATPPAQPPGYGECPDCPQPPLPECPPPPPPPQLAGALPQPPPPPPLAPVKPPPPPPMKKHHQPSGTPSTPLLGLSAELTSNLKTIARFKKLIFYDPLNITKTWKGNKLCVDKTKYVGFICDTTRSGNKLRIAGVNFNQYRFNGKYHRPIPIKNFIRNLKGLVFFHANSNNFAGGLPLQINKIPNLLELDLSNNKYGGAFPTEVLGATNLTFLDFRFNQFAGPIHPQVFTLDLDVLFLNNNGFNGTIPKKIGQTPSLYLTLANNQLTGQIPKSIGQTSRNLLEILLLNNRLSGCLPYEIGFLNQSTVFDASINKLTGPIPKSFGCLTEMKIMNFSYNSLYGGVPESLCSLEDLQILDLKSNFLTKVGVACRRLIKNGVLNVSMNCIDDLPNQRSALECKGFFSKPHTCPDPKSLNYVPCDINSLSGPQRQEEATAHRVKKKEKKITAPSPAYQALNNNHN